MLACGIFGCTPSASTADDVSNAALGDYGDAPDERPTGYRTGARQGHFPTLAMNNGARALHPQRAWLGESGSVERGPSDPNDPDGRSNLDYDDDDGLQELSLNMDQHPVLAGLVLRVGRSDPDIDLWLNVLVDLNGDGRWGGSGRGDEREWAVQNFVVDMAKGDTGTRSITVPPFIYGNGPELPMQLWMRVAVTDRPIESSWDGTGQFGAGEVEDYFVELVDSDVPLVTLSCENPDSPNGHWGFNGSKFASVECSVSPVGSTLPGQVHFDIKRLKGGVRHTLMCGSLELDAGSNEKRVQGVSAANARTRIECLYERAGALPSEWEFAVPIGSSASRVTARGVELGHGSVAATRFVIERGSCPLSCSSDSGCFGGKVCASGCCVVPWSPDCEAREPAQCGRCCAMTAGKRAAECVRRACAL